MANRTVKGANTIKGTNPQFLIEKIIRSRIYESRYWKEECFALTAELLVDKALQLKVIIQVRLVSKVFSISVERQQLT
jgi:pre-mRNA-splicing factor 38A